jgi:hypothetical protein
MSTTVVSWNLDHWRRTPDQREGAWRYLADVLGADAALVQEAGPPPDGWRVVGDLDTGVGRPWGAAVASPHHELRPVTEVRQVSVREAKPFKSSVPGAAATATLSVDGLDLTLTSLYGLMQPRDAYASMNRHLADLVPLLDSSDHFRQVIVGGDLNLTTQWSGAVAGYAGIDRAILDQFRAWGLRDLLAEEVSAGPLAGCPCAEGENCRHLQTWFPATPGWPHQNDYLFLSSRFRRPISVRLDTEVVDRGLSDHAALVLTIDPT